MPCFKGMEKEWVLLEFKASMLCVEATFFRWRAATFGYYHSKRCLSIAISEWKRQTAVFWPNFLMLFWKMSSPTHPAQRALCAIFFSMWKQAINLRILAERNLFRRARRFTWLWQRTTFYIRKARTTKNLFEVSLPMLALQAQMSDIKRTRGIVLDHWLRTLRMCRFAHVLNSHATHALVSASRVHTPVSSVSAVSSAQNTPRLCTPRIFQHRLSTAQFTRNDTRPPSILPASAIHSGDTRPPTLNLVPLASAAGANDSAIGLDSARSGLQALV